LGIKFLIVVSTLFHHIIKIHKITYLCHSLVAVQLMLVKNVNADETEKKQTRASLSVSGCYRCW